MKALSGMAKRPDMKNEPSLKSAGQENNLAGICGSDGEYFGNFV
jgi:hypothetical protein